MVFPTPIHIAKFYHLVLLEAFFMIALPVTATAAAFGSSPIEALCDQGQVCSYSIFVDVRPVPFALMFLAGALLNCKQFLSVPLV
mmetsp:Transcript_88347/g.230243  ORF Transcript_88347/g.230243 Transcript_88347/m.230243 type:complete len:85 (-) Transcript_88347:321-575(-)